MSNEMFANPQALTQQVISAANSLSDEEAAQRYHQILAQLPPDQAAELNALALSQVGATDRRQLAAQFRQAHEDPRSPFDGYEYDDDDTAASPQGLGRMTVRAQQQDPRLLGGLLGEGSPLGGPIGRAALAALAALLIRRMLSGQGTSGQGSSGQGLPAGSADAIAAILDSLLRGGAAGGLGGRTAPAPAQQPTPAGDIGDLLGGLLGGQAGRSSPAPGQPTPAGDIGDLLGGLLGGRGGMEPQSRPAPSQSAPGGGLGDLLGGLLGGGAGAQHIPAGNDLGSLISSILGGGQAAPDQATPDQKAIGSHRKEGIRSGGSW